MKTYIIEFFLIAVSFAVSCSERPVAGGMPVTVELDCGRMQTRSGGYDEDLVWDVNLFVTGCEGIAEEHVYCRFDPPVKGIIPFELSLLREREYSIYAFANAGYDMGQRNGRELAGMKFYIPYPDSFDHGMPMSGMAEDVTIADGSALPLRMERLVSKVSVSLDRSRLDRGLDFHIAGIRVGNCPRCALAFRESKAEGGGDLFPSGYYAEGTDMTEVYLLENRQKRMDADLCSYVEMEIDYRSDHFYTEGGRGLIYRFYLRENDSFDVMRNCHYHITVCPEQDGLLCDDSWRVDRRGLVTWKGDPYLKIIPEGTSVDGVFYDHYYEMDRNTSRHFDLAYSPSYMELWLRDDLVDDEKADGRALYEMDADGKGFTVTSLGKECTTMMEIHAGAPLNDYEMIAIRVR